MTAKSIQPGLCAQIEVGKPKDGESPSLTVLSTTGSFMVFGTTAIAALRDACNEALGESDSDNLRSLIMDLKPPTP